AQAAAGHGEDARQLPDKVIVMLRRQALRWLRADLALWVQELDSTHPEAPGAVQQALQRWQQDTGLAGVRTQEALARLPAEDCQAWLALWVEVASHVQQAEARANSVRELEHRLPQLLGGEAIPASVRELLTAACLATHRHRQYAATKRLIE